MEDDHNEMENVIHEYVTRNNKTEILVDDNFLLNINDEDNQNNEGIFLTISFLQQMPVK